MLLQRFVERGSYEGLIHSQWRIRGRSSEFKVPWGIDPEDSSILKVCLVAYCALLSAVARIGAKRAGCILFRMIVDPAVCKFVAAFQTLFGSIALLSILSCIILYGSLILIDQRCVGNSNLWSMICVDATIGRIGQD